jgi:hypothetical protein
MRAGLQYAADDDLQVERIGIFCHGTSKGLSLGYDLKNVSTLARRIERAVRGERPESVSLYVNIYLFACKTGRSRYHWSPPWNNRNKKDRAVAVGDIQDKDGFAMVLCKELYDLGVTANILAHTTSGHTVRNPHKVIVSVRDGMVVRRYICAPGSPMWRRWRLAMREVGSREPFVLLDEESSDWCF